MRQKELLAYNKNNQEMCKYIKAQSLKFLSLDGLYKALIGEERNQTYLNSIIILQVNIELNLMIICMTKIKTYLSLMKCQ